MKRLLTLTTVLAPALLLAGCAHTPPMPSGGRYVAMGSSYAAGAGLEPIKPDTPTRCSRSQINYPSNLAHWMGLTLVDVTCGGATTQHILGPWNELPAQIDAVTADTRLVTITIGGNDVGYVTKLMMASCSTAAGRTCPQIKLPEPADWARLSQNLEQIVRQIHTRAPGAKVVFVDYVTLIPEKGTCPAVPFDEVTIAAMRAMGAKLAEVTDTAARNSGAEIFHAGDMSKHHTPCDEDPWSVGAPGSAPGAPWHPNATAHSAIAEALMQVLARR